MVELNPAHGLRESPLANLPPWLRRPIGKASEISTVQQIIKQRQIHTICEEGRCPNRGECYAQKTATFLLMGAVCTRAVLSCQVDKGHAPMPLDPDEPRKVAEAVSLLGLRYVVLTSVARDDLPDQGAGWFVAAMTAIRQANPQTQIELLTPDFWGGLGSEGLSGEERQRQRIETVVAAAPACYNHNIETVRRLQNRCGRGAKYERSLQVLQMVKELDHDDSHQVRTDAGAWRNGGRNLGGAARFERGGVRSPYFRTVHAPFTRSPACSKILDA